jgi:hypothetical protein
LRAGSRANKQRKNQNPEHRCRVRIDALKTM